MFSEFVGTLFRASDEHKATSAKSSLGLSNWKPLIKTGPGRGGRSEKRPCCLSAIYLAKFKYLPTLISLRPNLSPQAFLSRTAK